MNETISIHGTTRAKQGKSAVRKIRTNGLIPAVVYGHNFNALSLSLNAGEINKLFKTGRENAEEYRLFKLLIDSSEDTQGTMVMVKEIQRHPLNESIRHIDFFAVRMDEKIIAPVHIRIVGKSAGVKLGGILRHILRELEVKSLPNDIPPHFDVDVTEMQIGDSIHVKDLKVPENIQILTDPEAPIISVLTPTVQVEEKADGAETELVAAEAETKDAKAKDSKAKDAKGKDAKAKDSK
ncbi:MAG: 50S ribosomal protein L25 [Pseudomonadota bacterium]